MLRCALYFELQLLTGGCQVATGACKRTIHMDEQNSPVVHVSFTPNGKFLLMATLDSTLRLWDPAHNKCLKKYKGTVPMPA